MPLFFYIWVFLGVVLAFALLYERRRLRAVAQQAEYHGYYARLRGAILDSFGTGDAVAMCDLDWVALALLGFSLEDAVTPADAAEVALGPWLAPRPRGNPLTPEDRVRVARVRQDLDVAAAQVVSEGLITLATMSYGDGTEEQDLKPPQGLYVLTHAGMVEVARRYAEQAMGGTRVSFS